MPTFKDLPAELLDKIVFLACTDGGSTGRALALTSKLFARGSEHARYRTVSLVGGGALRSFSRVIQVRQPRIEHLFISDHNSSCPEWDAPDPSWLNHGRRGMHSLTRAKCAIRGFISNRFASKETRKQCLEQNRVAAHAAGVNEALELILGAVGSYLRTLSVVLVTAPRFILSPVSLPQLQELTMVTFCLHSATPLIPNYRRANLPRLTRLHLSDSRAPLPLILDTIPALTHLRLSGNKDPTQLLLELPDPLPETLKRIDIQPPMAHRNMGMAQICATIVHTVQQLHNAFAHHKRVRVVVDGDWVMDRYAYSQYLAQRDWQSRIEGGGGCWERGSGRAVREAS